MQEGTEQAFKRLTEGALDTLLFQIKHLTEMLG